MAYLDVHLQHRRRRGEADVLHDRRPSHVPPAIARDAVRRAEAHLVELDLRGELGRHLPPDCAVEHVRAALGAPREDVLLEGPLVIGADAHDHARARRAERAAHALLLVAIAERVEERRGALQRRTERVEALVRVRPLEVPFVSEGGAGDRPVLVVVRDGPMPLLAYEPSHACVAFG